MAGSAHDVLAMVPAGGGKALACYRLLVRYRPLGGARLEGIAVGPGRRLVAPPSRRAALAASTPLARQGRRIGT